MSLINKPLYIFVFPRSKDLFIPLQKISFYRSKNADKCRLRKC